MPYTHIVGHGSCIFLTLKNATPLGSRTISARDRVWGCWLQSSQAISLCSRVENRVVRVDGAVPNATE